MKLKLKANVSLTTVIVTSAVLLVSTITVMLSIMDMSKSSKNNYNYEMNTLRAVSCIEESMNRIKYNPNFTGTVTIAFGDGTCESVVSLDSDPNIRNLSITSQYNGYYYQVNKKADISQSPFYIFN
jgi:hypothetical protein